MESPEIAPKYALYREVAATDGAGPFTTKDHGINMGHYRFANIQVVPMDKPTVEESTGAGTTNAGAEVYFWNDALGKYVQGNPAITKTGPGAGVAYEFTVECLGRIMFVAVPGAVIAGQGVALFVSGYDLDHTL